MDTGIAHQELATLEHDIRKLDFQQSSLEAAKEKIRGFHEQNANIAADYIAAPRDSALEQSYLESLGLAKSINHH